LEKADTGYLKKADTGYLKKADTGYSILDKNENPEIS